ncbi:hypothetical protein [Actinoplanes subtropicus]|uniref:hypothetical protein n=1 Tax=Actinoplanes subtropicus TaxID=543632 RepID=UPI0004C440A6|nr:hypothetical protein [Actinoplanes subtropicus]
MDELFSLPGGPALSGSPAPAELSVFDRTFPARVAVLMRSRPITEAIVAANRQDWPAATYDIATFALAAIDLVIARQGFAEEATYAEVVDGLTVLARRAAPERTPAEHRRVGEYTVDALLNRGEREAPFTYRISDFTDAAGAHQQRQVQFRLLVEWEDAGRGEVVLKATRDAINALVGGLEFDVEDEQVANEVLLERQLAKGAFDAAERAAVRARLLSVSLAEDLLELIKNTRRDLRAVTQEWATVVPQRLAAARDHIAGRMEADHRLLAKVRESLESDDLQVTMAAARIAALLTECSRRHDALHRQVLSARGVFLEEQNRQSFRPPALGHLPDLDREILTPLLSLDSGTALTVTDRWLSDVTGPRPPKLPRLYRLVYDLWAVRDATDDDRDPDADDEAGDPDPPTIGPHVVAAARRVVVRTGLPARLSALLADALTDPGLDDPADRQRAAEILALAALWCFAPEAADNEHLASADLTARVLGPRAVADADTRKLELPGWEGDDLIIVAHPDALAAADPQPVTEALP